MRLCPLLRVFAMLLFAATQGGCLLTTHMWKDANNEFAFGPHLVIFQQSAASPSHTQVIYEVGGQNESTYLLFNIPAECEANYTFSPGAWLRQTPTTLSDPAPTEEQSAQYARIAAMSLPDKCFVRTITFGEMQHLIATSPAKWLVRDPRGARITTNVRVFIVGGFADAPPNAPIVQTADGHDLRITPAAQFMIVPNQQRRPKSEQNGAKVRAVFLTPLTIVGDAVLAPVYLFVLLNMPKC